MRFKNGVAAFASVALVVAVLIANPRQGGGVIPNTGWRMPVDVGGTATDEDWIRLGWDSFVALNWPAANQWPKPGNGGKPDKKSHITQGTGRPTVWQTYLAPGQVFIEGGKDPGAWNLPTEPFTSRKDPTDPKRLLPVLGGFEEKSIYFLTQNPDFGLALYDLATTPNPVVDQLGNYVLLEVRVNQSEFEYFKNTGYYDARRQIADTRNSAKKFKYLPATGNADLPDWARQGAVEIKASWRILDPSKDIVERYFTHRAFYLKPDGTVTGPVTLGLVGLHILRNTPKSTKTWFWTTFEHVDNVAIAERPVPKRPNGRKLSASFNPGPAGAEPKYPYGFELEGRFKYSNIGNEAAHYNPVVEPAMISKGDKLPRFPADPPVNCSRVTPIRPAVAAMNKEYQDKLRGSVWQYYEMIDVLYPQEDGISEVKKPNDEDWNPKLYINTPALVNTTMETYLTYRFAEWTLDSCMSCHYLAKPILPDGTDEKAVAPPQVFSYMYRRATKS